MSNADVAPELKQIIGALIFGADRSLTIKEIRSCLIDVARTGEEGTAVFAKIKDDDIKTAVDQLQEEIRQRHLGFFLTEVAGGYKLQSDHTCGKWLKHLLDAGKPNRLSMPALETLSIIAYRQPITKAEIENIRGVTVDHVIKALLEMQLIRIAGRSDLPGRPFLYRTSHAFLEHFGLKDLNSLDDMEPLLKVKSDYTESTAQVENEPLEQSEEKTQQEEKTTDTEDYVNESEHIETEN